MRTLRRLVVLLVLVATVPEIAGAVTIFSKEVICPVCGTKNTFGEYGSWGSYVYQWPSKYQFVFWPYTYGTTWYVCKHCHLALLMWDFTEFPKEKVEAARGVLKDVKLEKEYKDYDQVPMSVRLEIAEKVYRVLDKDDAFWAHFYRAAGYHLAQENKVTAAAEARKRALEYTQKLLDKNAEPGHKKELLLASAAMKHFLHDDPGAQSDLATAATLRFTDPKMEPERAKGYDEYLSRLIADYQEKIKNKSVPADLPTDKEERK